MVLFWREIMNTTVVREEKLIFNATSPDGRKQKLEVYLGSPLYRFFADQILAGWSDWSLAFPDAPIEHGFNIEAWKKFSDRVQTMISRVGFEPLQAKLRGAKMIGLRLYELMYAQGC
jgi:hypothetical protein